MKTELIVALAASGFAVTAASAADVIIGDTGTQSFNNTVTHTIIGNLILGNQPTGNGTYTITGNSAQTNVNFAPGGNGGNPNGALIIGELGTGTFIQGSAGMTDPGNAVNVAGDLVLGHQIGSLGSYTLNTGALTVGGQLAVGGKSTGANSFVQNGGTVTLSGTAPGNPDYVSVGPGFAPFGGTLSIGGGIGTGDGSNSGGVGTYTLNDGTINLSNNFLIGGTGTGTMNQAGGAVTTHFMTLGFAGNGTYNLSAGTLNAFSAAVGYAGTGAFNQSGGTYTVATDFFVGANCCGNSPGQGAYNLTGGTLTTGNARIGDGEMGTMVVSNANGPSTQTVTGNLIVGGAAGGVGSYTITGNTSQTNVVFVPGGNGPADPPGSNGFHFDPTTMTNVDNGAPNGALIVGHFGNGTFTQGLADHSDFANTVNVAGDVVLGNQVGSQGLYTLNEGTLTVGGKLVVGGASKNANLFTQNGGTVNITGFANGSDYVGVGGNDFNGWVLIGGGVTSLSDGTGTYQLNGGILLVRNGGISVGSSGVGTFNQTGGTVNTGFLSEGNCGGCNGSNSDGRYNLTGTGVLMAGGESIGQFGHGEFHQNGAATQNIVGGTLALGDGPIVHADNNDPGNPPFRSGSYQLDDGRLTTNNTIVASQGVGTFTQTGGIHTVASNLIVGEQNPVIERGCGDTCNVGGPSQGVYIQTGGLVTIGSWYDGQILANGSTVGSAMAGNLVVGAAGNGTYNLGVTGQTNNVQWGGYPGQPDPMTFPPPPAFDNAVNAPFVQVFGNIAIGRDAGSTGAFNLAGNGSTLWSNFVANSSTGGTMTIGRDGTGTFTQSDKTTVYLDGGLAIGLNATGIGSFTMNGGANGGGTLSVGGTLNIGGSDDASGGPLSQTTMTAGAGSFTQNAGTVTVQANLNIATNPSAIGTYTLKGGTLTVNGAASIGNNGGSGTVTQTGGTATVGNMFLGTTPASGPVSTGIYNLSSTGSLVVNDSMVIAQAGNIGTFTQDGANSSVLVNNFLTIGEDTGATGTYNLKAGTLTAGNTLLGFGSVVNPGNGGVGNFNQSGGTFNTTFLNIGGGGFTAKGQGTYTMTAGSLVVGDSLNIGNGSGGSGSFEQSAGSVQVNGTFIGGNISGLYVNHGSEYDISGTGSLTVANSVFVGGSGGGSFTQAGGSVVVIGADSTSSSSVAKSQVLFVGDNSGDVGSYSISGGTLTVYGNAASNNSSITVGGSGSGLFVQSGGTVNAHGVNSLAIGDCCGGSGEYRLSNGVLTTTGNAYVGAHTLGTMNQTNGSVFVGGALFVGLDTSGPAGGGFYNQSGGSVSVSSSVSMGTLAGATGSWNLSGVGSVFVNNAMIVGENGVGTFTQTGSGTHASVVGDLTIGRFNTTTASSYALNSGLLETGRTIVGDQGIGTFAQNGGTLSTGGLRVGQSGTGTGTYTMNSGTVTVFDTNGVNGGTRVGLAGNGTFNLNGGTHNTTFLEIGGTNFAQGGGGTGTYNVNGGNLNASGNISTNPQGGSHGLLNVAGGAVSASGAIINNDRVTLSSGSIAAGGINNNNGGQVSYSGGSLTIGGGTGTLTNFAGGTVTLSGAGTRVVDGNLSNAGTVNLSTAAQVNVLNQNGGIISLNANNLTVAKDYTNVNFGTGNNFNARAGVTGTGQIVGLNASEAITGGVAAAGANTYTINFGNVRGGGTTTVNYQIANTGTGADIRGAIQTGTPGLGNITDSRLSGTGVPTGGANFGPIAAGGNSGNLAVTFNSTSGGGSLTGQSIAIVSNLGNVATQTINLIGTASALAVGNATPGSPPTVNLGNFRVGGTVGQDFAVTNTAAGTTATTERLGIGSVTTTGNFDATNNLGAGLINPGQSQGAAVHAQVSGGTAGVNNGSVNIQYTTNGTLIDPSFTTMNANAQSINVTATGFNLATGNATPSPTITLGAFHVGQAGGLAPQNQSLAVANTAPTTFSEQLGIGSANVSGAFTLTNNLGSTLINAGATVNNALNVARNGGVAGVNSGTIAIQYTSDGTNTSGFSAINSNLQNVGIQATGYNLAAASVTPNPVTVANQRIGGSNSAALSVANTAPVSATFTETLSGSFANANTGSATNNGGSVTGIAGGGNNNTAMRVGVDTSGAGARTGTVTVNLSSNEVNSSGLGNTALAPQVVTVNGNVYQVAAGSIQTAPLNFGTVQVGQGVSQNLTIRNTATGPNGFVEDLNAAFGSSTDARIIGSGNLNGILAGASSTAGNGTMTVSINTSAAGTVNGSIHVNYASAGAVNGTSNGLGTLAVGGEDYAASGTIQANVVDTARPVINGVANPGGVNVNLGNLRINTGANQTLTVLNQSSGSQQAALNASIASNGAPITASGSFNQLLPGNTSPGQAGIGTLQVGVSSAAPAGHVAGTATVSLVSDASNIGNCAPNCAFNLPSQTVNVAADVYRLANPVVNTGPITLNARVGATSPQASISISNSSPDSFTEGLDVARGSTPAGFTSSGSISNLAAQATSTAIGVSLNTAAAGHVGGTQVLQFASNGTITGNSNVALPDGGVTLSGNVYQVATGAIQTAPLNFGTVQVGQSVSQNLTIRNTATGPNGFVEDLNAAFGSSTDARIIGSGNLNGILAGASSTAGNGTMTVSINTSAAGTVNGSIHVNYASAGAVNGTSNGLGTLAVGGEDYAANGTIQANVVDTARPVINGVANPGSVNVNLGNLRINTTANQTLTVLNQSSGSQQAALNASIASNGAPITASGSFNQLLPGNTSPGQAGIGTLQVGVSSTAPAGHVAGTATVSLVSDASNIGNCAPNCQMSLPSQTVNVAADVYRLANPLINTPSPITLAGRVGGVGDTTHLSSAISISNSSSDAFSEGLNVTRGSTPSGFTSSGSITNLAAQGTSTAIGVSLNTAAAGHVGGTQVLQFASNGTLTNNANLALSDGSITLSGNVYTPAVAQVTSTTPVNFGIVHVGDATPSATLTVRNNAALTALNDTLQMSFASASAPFGGGGSLVNLGAQQSNASSLTVTMSTATAGVYSGQAAFNAASHDSELADLALTDVDVALMGQVNNYAQAAFRENAGGGSFSGGGTSYVLDFGTLTQNSGHRLANLGVFNNVLGPADVLSGAFQFLDVQDFGETGFSAFAGLAASAGYDGLNLDFNTALLGSFQDQIRLTWSGSNASGYQGPDSFIVLTLRATVVQAGAVPEPGTLALMLLCLTVLAYSVASRRPRVPLRRGGCHA